MSDKLTKEEYLRSRIEKLKECKEDELKTRVNLGKRMSAMTSTDGWLDIKSYILGKVEEYNNAKASYSIADRFVSPDGEKREIEMIQFEAQIASIMGLLGHVEFMVDDGKVATAVLKSRENKVAVK